LWLQGFLFQNLILELEGSFLFVRPKPAGEGGLCLPALGVATRQPKQPQDKIRFSSGILVKLSKG